MSVQAVYDYVRGYLDSDDEDLPSSLLDVWLTEGVNRIQRAFEPWSFYEHAWTFEAGHEISFDEIGAADPDGMLPEVIQSVEADRWLLKYVPHEREVGRYAWSNATAGQPTEFSLHNDTVFIWPIPHSPAEYTARGYRRPIPIWGDDGEIVTTAKVDLPAEFDPLLCEWILTRAYEWQDDEVMSGQKLGRFEQQLEILRRRYLRAPKPGVQQMGTQKDGAMLTDRLAYTWEW